MKEIIYHFSCGCNMPQSEVARNKYNRIYCIKHLDAYLVKRQGWCKICGVETIQTKSRGSVSILCPACKKEQNRANMEKYRKDEVLAEIFNPVAAERKPDCKYYSECLDFRGYLLSKTNASCEGCKRYQPQELDIMDYAGSKDSFQETRANYC